MLGISQPPFAFWIASRMRIPSIPGRVRLRIAAAVSVHLLPSAFNASSQLAASRTSNESEKVLHTWAR